MLRRVAVYVGIFAAVLMIFSMAQDEWVTPDTQSPNLCKEGKRKCDIKICEYEQRYWVKDGKLDVDKIFKFREEEFTRQVPNYREHPAAVDQRNHILSKVRSCGDEANKKTDLCETMTHYVECYGF